MQPTPADDFTLPGLDGMPPPQLGSLADVSAEVPEVDATTAVTPEPEPATPTVTYEDFVALRQELETTKQRLTDTHRWGQEANSGRQMVEALLEARRAQEEIDRRAREATAAFTPPTLESAEERDALVSDPDFLANFIVRTTQAMVGRAYADLFPRVQAVEPVLGMIGPILEAEAERVAERVKGQVITAESGIKDEEFPALYDEARQALWTATKGDGAAYTRACLNPKAVLWAMRMAAEERGATSVRPAPRGPSIGTTAAAPARKAAPRVQVSADLGKIVNTFGLTAEEINESMGLARERANRRR